MRYRMALFAVLAVVIVGIAALLWSQPLAQRPGAAIDRLRFDTSGWRVHDTALSSTMWKNIDDDLLELKVVREIPGIAANSDATLMREEARRLADENRGSLVDADLFTLSGHRAGALIYKRGELPPHDYVGMLMMWTDADHYVVTMVSKDLARVRATLSSIQKTARVK
jgi:hypothetical protein